MDTGGEQAPELKRIQILDSPLGSSERAGPVSNPGDRNHTHMVQTQALGTSKGVSLEPWETLSLLLWKGWATSSQGAVYCGARLGLHNTGNFSSIHCEEREATEEPK